MTSYSKTSFALQYPNGKLVAIDLSSGGYPYEASDIREVWVTDKKVELERYKNSGFEHLTVVPIIIEVKIG